MSFWVTASLIKAAKIVHAASLARPEYYSKVPIEVAEPKKTLESWSISIVGPYVWPILAILTGTWYSYSKVPIEVAEPNVLGTYYLLRYAAEVSCEAFLYFSSGDIYGKISSAVHITEDMAGCVNPLGFTCNANSGCSPATISASCLILINCSVLQTLYASPFTIF